MLIDSHCHLDPAYLPDGPEPVLARARAAGVRGFVVIGVGQNLDSMVGAVAIASRHDHIVATVGIHPHDAATADARVWDTLSDLGAHDRVVAIGEIGLDYHYDHSPHSVQVDVFRRCIQLARDLKKPIVIHTRSAPGETLAILREEHAEEVGGIIHCFSEDREFARGALDLGFDLSFSGIVTFKTAKAIQDVAGWAPIDRILVETDSPFLAPVPLRGKTNEPANVVHTVAKIAELRATTSSVIAEKTTANTLRRFGHALKIEGAS
ncbi:MAG: TatD family hydrolase [Polyangiaceae bacterium]